MKRDLRKKDIVLFKNRSSNPLTGRTAQYEAAHLWDDSRGIADGYLFTVLGEVEKPFFGRPTVRIYNDPESRTLADAASPYAAIENSGRGVYCIEVGLTRMGKVLETFYKLVNAGRHKPEAQLQ